MTIALLFMALAALAAEVAHMTGVERRDIAILSTQAAIVFATAAVAIVLVAAMDL